MKSHLKLPEPSFMKTQYLIKFLLSVLPFTAFSQQPVISILINGKTIGSHLLTEDVLVIPVQKMKYKNVSSVTILYKQKNMSDVYKRSLDITTSTDSVLYHVAASKAKPGWFVINIKAVRHILAKEKNINVYLVEDPANKMMALASRRKLLAAIHFI